MFCKKCGSEIADNANFCVKCGEKINEQIISGKAEKIRSKSLHGKKVIALVGVIALLALCYLFVNQSRPTIVGTWEIMELEINNRDISRAELQKGGSYWITAKVTNSSYVLKMFDGSEHKGKWEVLDTNEHEGFTSTHYNFLWEDIDRFIQAITQSDQEDILYINMKIDGNHYYLTLKRK